MNPGPSRYGRRHCHRHAAKSPAPATPAPALAIMNGHVGCWACSHTTFEYLPEAEFPGLTENIG